MPCEVNSHPQRSDDDNKFVVVHNGIITNYKEVRKNNFKYDSLVLQFTLTKYLFSAGKIGPGLNRFSTF